MAKFQSDKEIRKTMQEIQTNKTRLERTTIMRRCECLHRYADGRPSLDPNGGAEKGQFRCQICGKFIKITRTEMDELMKAYDLIDQQCDAIKLTCSNPDAEIIKDVVMYQKSTARMREVMSRMLQQNQGKNQNRNNQQRRNDTGNARIVWPNDRK